VFVDTLVLMIMLYTHRMTLFLLAIRSPTE